MSDLQVAGGIFYVGKIDDREISFHRTPLKKGTTYNSYLLLTEKPTVIDTVDPTFGKEFVDNLSKFTDPAGIRYIISSHVEPDHSGAIPALAARAKNAQIVCTEKAKPILQDMFRLHNREFLVVKDGDSLDIGGKTLRFLETPYIHTEETMMTYDEKEGILFPCDGFSSFIAAHEVFNDKTDINYDEDFEEYYKAIMAPHRPYIRKMLDKVKPLPIHIIAPSHGYVHRKDPDKYIEFYDKWSSPKAAGKEKNILIIYSSMTGNTGKIAERIAKGMAELDITPEIINIKNADTGSLKSKIRESDGILVGSSTKYGDLVGDIEAFIQSLQGGDFKNKFAAAFGSYGWSGEAIAHLDEQLEALGFKMINHRYLVKNLGRSEPILPLRVKFNREEDAALAEEAGRVFAEQVLSFTQ
ncbi:MAG: FprA family A-type flavoprotein [Clostridia bacterium]|nr:FprA family A-type flavoprotein [Clostridia bacterium]